MNILKMTVVCAFALAASMSGAEGVEIVYHGRVATVVGAGYGGTFDMTFRIYDEEGAETPMWTMTAPITTDADGDFQAVFSDSAEGIVHEGDGAVHTIQDLVADGRANYLGITIANGREITPRQPILPQPLAMNANSASGIAKDGKVDSMEVESIECGKLSGYNIPIMVSERLAGGIDCENRLNTIHMPTNKFDTLTLLADKGMEVFDTESAGYGWKDIYTIDTRHSFYGCQRGVLFLSTLRTMGVRYLLEIPEDVRYEEFKTYVNWAWEAPGLVFFIGDETELEKEAMLQTLYNALRLNLCEIYNRKFNRED